MKMAEYCTGIDADLFLLHVEVVNDNADEQIECEERAEHDEKHEVEIHKHSSFGHRLQAGLHQQQQQLLNHLRQR